MTSLRELRITRLAMQLVAAKQDLINMGFPEIVSRILYEKYGKLAPLIAKWYKQYKTSSHGAEHSEWWRMVNWSFSDRVSLYAMTYMYENAIDPESYVKAADKMGLDLRGMGEGVDQSMVDEFRQSMIPAIRNKFFEEGFFTYYPLMKDISSGNLTDIAPYKKLGFDDAVMKYENKRHFEDIKPLKVYPNGFKWIDVGKKSVLLSQQMKNCGSAGLMSMDSNATILALFGPTNKPHVMVVYSPGEKRISGDECAGSTEVKPEYHDYVLDIANHMGSRFDEAKSKSTALRVKYLLKDKADSLEQIQFRDNDGFSYNEYFRFMSDGQEYYTDGSTVVSGAEMKRVQEMIDNGELEVRYPQDTIYKTILNHNNQRELAYAGVKFTPIYKFIGQWK
jgi:hypothetical protein